MRYELDGSKWKGTHVSTCDHLDCSHIEKWFEHIGGPTMFSDLVHIAGIDYFLVETANQCLILFDSHGGPPSYINPVNAAVTCRT